MEPVKPIERSSVRHFSAEFKAQVLAACDQPGARITEVAARHGLRVGLLHKWRAGLRRKHALVAGAAVAPTRRSAQVGQFVAVPLPNPESGGAREPRFIHVDLQRPWGLVHIRWPVSDAVHCGNWLNAWLK